MIDDYYCTQPGCQLFGGHPGRCHPWHPEQHVLITAGPKHLLDRDVPVPVGVLTVLGVLVLLLLIVWILA